VTVYSQRLIEDVFLLAQLNKLIKRSYSHDPLTSLQHTCEHAPQDEAENDQWDDDREGDNQGG
jgi:hypothetical protein